MKNEREDSIKIWKLECKWTNSRTVADDKDPRKPNKKLIAKKAENQLDLQSQILQSRDLRGQDPSGSRTGWVEDKLKREPRKQSNKTKLEKCEIKIGELENQSMKSNTQIIRSFRKKEQRKERKKTYKVIQGNSPN